MAHLYDICFSNASGYVEVCKGGLSRQDRKWIKLDHLIPAPTDSQDVNHFFGPAVRSKPGVMGKANCKGSWVCWVDVDRPELPESIIPPTCTVMSGHGWHLYWWLRAFESNQDALEDANKALARLVGGDSAHNIDRVLRQPGTINHKNGADPVLCEVRELVSGRRYDIDELLCAERVDERIVKKILTGDRRGYASRSERDFAIIKELVALDYTPDTIELIFRTHACGDKFRTAGNGYLERTIENARESISQGPPRARGRRGRKPHVVEFRERENCYYLFDGRSERQVSTFTLEPTMLLEGPQDFVVCNIRAQSTDYVWEDVVWPRSAFGGLRAMSDQLTKASWVWLGRDADVRLLLDHLVQQLTEIGIPRAVAVQQLGRHTLPGDDRVFAVLNDCTLASDGSIWFDVHDSPITYVSTGRECPKASPVPMPFDEELAETLNEYLPKVNDPEVFWPVLGWFLAAPLKPALEEVGYRFPILNVTGTRGSGKTTLLLEVMQPLLGVCGARGYDAGTTRFVALSLLGSTNAIPVNFSEFRAAMTPEFLRFVLLSYDSGKDARGRPDQTTVTYPLTAPFTLDGEDKVADSAALERVVIVTLTPRTIEEESDAWCAFAALRELVDLQAFALPYWQFTLSLDVGELMREAERQMFESFEQILPTRIRRNLTVVWAGVLAYVQFMAESGVEAGPDKGAEVLRAALENVYSTQLGRALTAADEFAEFVVNNAAQHTKAFPWLLEDGILWFQHTPAFEFYLSRRASQRQITLTREALKQQLRELTVDYTEEPKVKDLKGRRVLAYGIDLHRAYEAGLDVPDSFKSASLVVDF